MKCTNFRIFYAEFDRFALGEFLIFVYFSCEVDVNYGESRIVDSEPEKDPISVDCQKQAIMSQRYDPHSEISLYFRRNQRSWLNLPCPKRSLQKNGMIQRLVQG